MKSLLFLFLIMGLMACGQKAKPVSTAGEKPAVVQTSSKADSSSILLQAFQVSPVSFTIYPSADTALKIGDRGTVLHIPKSAFVAEDGSVVTKPVSIEFKEYTNAAEMAFSSIPMTHKQGGRDYVFSSSGMFDISGTADGKPVNIAAGKKLKIDYPLTKKNPDLAFYKLDKETNTWTKLNDINTAKPAAKAVVAEEPQSKFWVKYAIGAPPYYNKELFWMAGGKEAKFVTMLMTKVPETTKVAEYLGKNPAFYLSYFFAVDSNTGRIYNVHANMHNPTKEYDAGFVSAITSLSPCRLRNSQYTYSLSFSNDYFEVQVHVTSEEQQKQERLMVAQQEAAITYNNFSNGLAIESFGIYNCDRLMSIPERVNVIASYSDASTGKPISDGYLLSMIDMKNNTAISSQPDHFVCDGKAEYTFLLITLDKKVYLYRSKSITKTGEANTTVNYAFAMNNMSDKIKSASDILQYAR